MKQLLFILTLVVSTSIAYSQDSTQYVTNTNAEKLVDKYIDKAGAVIEALAVALKQPAEHVYKVLVKQQVVNSLTNVSIFLIGIILILSVSILNKKADWSDGNLEAVSVVIIGLVSLVIIIYTLATFNRTLQGFINPEYGALKEIIKMIK